MFIKIHKIIIPTYKPESNSVSRSICLSATFLRLNCRIDFDEFWNTSRWDLEEVYRKPWAKVMLKYIFKRYWKMKEIAMKAWRLVPLGVGITNFEVFLSSYIMNVPAIEYSLSQKFECPNDYWNWAISVSTEKSSE